jgi:hypothetical protein
VSPSPCTTVAERPASTGGLARPVGLDDVRHDDQQRVGAGRPPRQQRLRRLAEAWLVGEQERAVAVGSGRDDLRLVRHQLAPQAARSEVGRGSVMHEDAPPEAFSNDRSSGRSSSHAGEQPRASGGGRARRSPARGTGSPAAAR